MPDEDQIKEHAYFLWAQAGKPHGRSQEFWLMAEKELKAAPAPVAKLEKAKTAAAAKTPKAAKPTRKKSGAATLVAAKPGESKTV
jgi:hypothetical protein